MAVLLPLSLCVLARDTMGALLALSQLAVAFAFAAIRRYERGARRSVDTPARRIRQRIGTACGVAW
ncbi:hypothetical protein [Actinacidiphila glaucinigra]|uniref:hypothetical protein n=1 Tax=Actinacidiphila glaucinigra TaxID=235986 RepID=UPI0036E00341